MRHSGQEESGLLFVAFSSLAAGRRCHDQTSTSRVLALLYNLLLLVVLVCVVGLRSSCIQQKINQERAATLVVVAVLVVLQLTDNRTRGEIKITKTPTRRQEQLETSMILALLPLRLYYSIRGNTKQKTSRQQLATAARLYIPRGTQHRRLQSRLGLLYSSTSHARHREEYNHSSNDNSSQPTWWGWDMGGQHREVSQIVVGRGTMIMNADKAATQTTGRSSSLALTRRERNNKKCAGSCRR